jgi:hypothetical protein
VQQVDGALFAHRTRDQDQRHGRPGLAHPLGHFLDAQTRQGHVDQHDIARRRALEAARERRQGGGALAVEGIELRTQGARDQQRIGLVVLDEQNARHAALPWAAAGDGGGSFVSTQ